uniref:Membrane-bound O-acyltransferase domain-containing protein 2 n=1 Tax=Rhabditophanes sp. KR3021 TaxID=114890 RepID=A0AC35TN23_9BILA
MGYLFFLHWYKFYVLTSYSIDVTGTMMVIVQKCTTLAFSLHDGRVKKPEQLNEIQKKEAIKTPPPLMLYLSYMFMYQTVMTGPLCFYTDYKKFIEGDHLKINNGKIPTPHKSALSKLFMTIIFMTIILTMGQITPESIASSEYMAMPFLKWAAYWFIAIFVCRVQYYYVWVTADAVANVSGFGFNGYEENGNEKWDLITNVHPIKVEMAQSFKETLDNWNCTTMYWLRRVAYDRVPKNMRTVSTYLLSALWHGFFPGYYITFTGGALLTLAFRTTRRCLRWRFVGSKVQKQVYDVVSFASTKVCLAYITMPFVTMHLNPGWFLYKQVYFCVHIAALAAIFILPLIFPAEKKVVPEKEANLQKNK